MYHIFVAQKLRQLHIFFRNLYSGNIQLYDTYKDGFARCLSQETEIQIYNGGLAFQNFRQTDGQIKLYIEGSTSPKNTVVWVC